MKPVNDFSRSGHKVMSFPKQVNTYLADEGQSLIVAEMDMTNRCNNNCRFCAGGRTNSSSLSLEAAKTILSQLKNFGVKAVIFSGGGEPLINPITMEAIEFAESLKLKVGLLSNGLALDPTMFATILSACTFFRVSLDAGTPEMYKKTHGMDECAFDKVLDNLSQLLSFRKLFAKTKTAIGVAYLIGKETSSVADVEDFVQLAAKLQVDFAHYRPYHWSSTFSEMLDFWPDFVEKHSTPSFRVAVSSQKFDFGRNYKTCHGANFTTVIGADAKVYLCCHSRGQPDRCLGDLKIDPFPVIWDRRKKIISTVQVGACLPQCRCDAMNHTLQSIIDGKQQLPNEADILISSDHEYFL